jgi:hypothetical protein
MGSIKKKACFSYLEEHLYRLKKISEEAYIPMSSLIRKALNDFFVKYDKEQVCQEEKQQKSP